MQVVAHTLRPNVGSTGYGSLTFKFARILLIDRLAIDGQWTFASGARGDLNVTFTLTNGKLGATFTITSGMLGMIALTDGTR